jgi:hypothetical protein
MQAAVINKNQVGQIAGSTIPKIAVQAHSAPVKVVPTLPVQAPPVKPIITSVKVSTSAQEVVPLAPNAVAKTDSSVVTLTKVGAGIGAMFSPLGTFVGSVVSGCIAGVSSNDKAAVILPTAKQGAKAGALGSLFLSVPAALAGVTAAVTIGILGTGVFTSLGIPTFGITDATLLALSFVGIGVGSAVVNTGLSALTGALGSLVVKKVMK